MDDVISKIIYTLNLIEVHGADNMSRLLGCIQELKKLKDGDEE